MYKERCCIFLGPECHFWESHSLLLVIEIQPWCFCFLLMMHLCLLRDGITPLRNAQHSHSHLVSLTHLLSFTPSARISLQRGPICLIIDLVHNHCLLAVCQTECWHKARPPIESKSLCRSYSTPSTGPRCRTFTYTERLSNLHWQLANTEHLQQLLLSASSSNTHRRVSNYTHILIRVHTYTHKCIQTRVLPWPIHNHPSNRLYLAAGIKPSFSSTRPQQTLNGNKCTFSFS